MREHILRPSSMREHILIYSCSTSIAAIYARVRRHVRLTVWNLRKNRQSPHTTFPAKSAPAPSNTDTETQRQTHGQTGTQGHKDRDTDRHKDKHKDRDRDTRTDTGTQGQGHKERHTDRHRDTRTDTGTATTLLRAPSSMSEHILTRGHIPTREH
jgi:hypothetical protein